MKPIRAFGNAQPAEVDRKEGKSGECCRSLGLPGGGRKAAVALGDAGWCFSVRRSFSGAGNLNLSLNLSWGGAWLFLGEVEVGLWRGLREDEVEGRGMAAWVDRLRSPAWERGLVFWAGSAGGAVAWGEQCRSVGLPGGGRKAAVALGDAALSSTSTLTLTSASASASAGPPVPPVFHQIKKTLGAPTNFNRCPCRS
ncbi:MAG: hypothetical protein ACE362_28530 [Phaeodactylibacter xiamenensis]|uniref:Uncharacterized protein n=1 Tax=Phaeodactylibacter xiamenensis TaxID=1524460 RepID=A0A098S3M2_9BACT|nr:hypothetical protein [Phaeodactylibacter xiamenensis]KGE86646.1 hypothetical protein IX84_20410 [Phaeodactylibacter xiamenensis]MCR9053941.1 hypothetical protein [bacterium]